MQMMDYQEFLGKLQKRGSNPHHVSHCLGSRDAWKWVRRNKWKALDGRTCEKCLYSRVVSEVNKILAEKILEGHEVVLPHGMGSFLTASLPSRIIPSEDGFDTNYRTDWLKTLRFWYEDEEARNTHKTIKRISPRIYFIRYMKRRANYRNRIFYTFRANRGIAKTLGKALERGKVQAMSLED